MGHTITGSFPNTPRWQDVLALLDSPALSAPAVAHLTLLAAERRLIQLRGDPSLTYCVWLLTRLATAARGPDFVGDAAQLGISVKHGDTALQVIARVTDRTRVELNRFPESGPFGEIASLARRSALMETVGRQQPSLRRSRRSPTPTRCRNPPPSRSRSPVTSGCSAVTASSAATPRTRRTSAA